jgi:hypothetical protein
VGGGSPDQLSTLHLPEVDANSVAVHHRRHSVGESLSDLAAGAGGRERPRELEQSARLAIELLY